MNEWEIILALVALFIFFILLIRKHNSHSSKNSVDAIKEPAFSVNSNYHGQNTFKTESILSNQTAIAQQLHFALLLTEKALPVWKKYIYSPEFLHYATFADAQNKIESSLLQKSIEEIKLISNTKLAGSENKNIIQLYNDFVNPVIALQDGIWITPYPVKKIFLSVYYLLKSIVEKTSSNDKETFLSTAISYAIECLELSKLYSSDEITSFLEMHNSFHKL